MNLLERPISVHLINHIVKHYTCQSWVEFYKMQGLWGRSKRSMNSSLVNCWESTLSIVSSSLSGFKLNITLESSRVNAPHPSWNDLYDPNHPIESNHDPSFWWNWSSHRPCLICVSLDIWKTSTPNDVQVNLQSLITYLRYQFNIKSTFSIMLLYLHFLLLFNPIKII